jgi:hypothetical protein
MHGTLEARTRSVQGSFPGAESLAVEQHHDASACPGAMKAAEHTEEKGADEGQLRHGPSAGHGRSARGERV